MIKQTEPETYNPIKNMKLIERLSKENEYLRKMLVERKEPINNLKRQKVIRIRRKTMDCIESDDEKDERKNISVAIKLLMLKYRFERQRVHVKHKKKERKNNGKNIEDNTSISDKVKQFGNLKPKQQFIDMGNIEDNQF